MAKRPLPYPAASPERPALSAAMPRRRTPAIPALCLFGLLLLLAAPLFGFDVPPCLKLASVSDALVLADADGRVLYAHNPERPLIPASTLKILTALTALHELGPDYRFETVFRLDARGNLYIQGLGDPLLLSEVWDDMARQLAGRLPAEGINDLVIDDSYFAMPILIPGQSASTNPYDAAPGALCANFNTVNFKRDRQGSLVSAEPQTPLTPLARERIREGGLDQGRVNFMREPHEPARYAAEICASFLARHGVKTAGQLRLGAAAPYEPILLRYRSPFALQAVVQKMMAFSNNFIAHQLLIAVGAKVYGPPGDLAKGLEALQRYAREELHLGPLQLVEGSGIARANRVSAAEMLVILKAFKEFRHLLHQEGCLRFKTGSLNGIRARAGYVEVAGGEPLLFVVLLNRSASRVEDIMRCLAHLCGRPSPRTP